MIKIDFITLIEIHRQYLGLKKKEKKIKEILNVCFRFLLLCNLENS